MSEGRQELAEMGGRSRGKGSATEIQGRAVQAYLYGAAIFPTGQVAVLGSKQGASRCAADGDGVHISSARGEGGGARSLHDLQDQQSSREEIQMCVWSADRTSRQLQATEH